MRDVSSNSNLDNIDDFETELDTKGLDGLYIVVSDQIDAIPRLTLCKSGTYFNGLKGVRIATLQNIIAYDAIEEDMDEQEFVVQESISFTRKSFEEVSVISAFILLLYVSTELFSLGNTFAIELDINLNHESYEGSN